MPTDLNIYPTKSWAKDALLQPERRAAFARLLCSACRSQDTWWPPKSIATEPATRSSLGRDPLITILEGAVDETFEPFGINAPHTGKASR